LMTRRRYASHRSLRQLSTPDDITFILQPHSRIARLMQSHQLSSMLSAFFSDLLDRFPCI